MSLDIPISFFIVKPPRTDIASEAFISRPIPQVPPFLARIRSSAAAQTNRAAKSTLEMNGTAHATEPHANLQYLLATFVPGSANAARLLSAGITF